MGSPVNWPDYPTPDGIGRDGTAVPPTGDTSSATPGTPPAGQPSGSDTPEHGTSGAADPAAPADGSVSPQGELNVPKYRFDEVSRGYESVAEQNRLLMGQVQQLTEALNRFAQPPAAAPTAAPVQLTEREQRIVSELDRLLQHSPTWQKLQPFIDKGDVLLQLAENLPARERAEADHWRGTADRVLANVLDAGVKTFKGPNATAEHLDPAQAQTLTNAFTRYVEADPQRVLRYERGDHDTLVKDFIGWFRGWVAGGVDPNARRAAADQQTRADAAQKLPTAGPTGQPVGSAPPKVNNNDEEAVHSAGWRAFQTAVGASR